MQSRQSSLSSRRSSIRSSLFGGDDGEKEGNGVGMMKEDTNDDLEAAELMRKNNTWRSVSSSNPRSSGGSDRRKHYGDNDGDRRFSDRNIDDDDTMICGTLGGAQSLFSSGVLSWEENIALKERRRCLLCSCCILILVISAIGVAVGLVKALKKKNAGQHPQEMLTDADGHASLPEEVPPPSSADELQQQPLSDLSDVCSPTNIAVPSGRSACLDRCEVASCCFDESHDCGLGMEDICQLYRPCVVVLNITTSRVPPAPPGIDELCSDAAVAPDVGFAQCEMACLEAACCWAISERENCYSDFPSECTPYGHCHRVNGGRVPGPPLPGSSSEDEDSMPWFNEDDIFNLTNEEYASEEEELPKPNLTTTTSPVAMTSLTNAPGMPVSKATQATQPALESTEHIQPTSSFLHNQTNVAIPTTTGIAKPDAEALESNSSGFVNFTEVMESLSPTGSNVTVLVETLGLDGETSNFTRNSDDLIAANSTAAASKGQKRSQATLEIGDIFGKNENSRKKKSEVSNRRFRLRKHPGKPGG